MSERRVEVWLCGSVNPAFPGCFLQLRPGWPIGPHHPPSSGIRPSTCPGRPRRTCGLSRCPVGPCRSRSLRTQGRVQDP